MDHAIIILCDINLSSLKPNQTFNVFSGIIFSAQPLKYGFIAFFSFFNEEVMCVFDKILFLLQLILIILQIIFSILQIRQIKTTNYRAEHAVVTNLQQLVMNPCKGYAIIISIINNLSSLKPNQTKQYFCLISRL